MDEKMLSMLATVRSRFHSILFAAGRSRPLRFSSLTEAVGMLLEPAQASKGEVSAGLAAAILACGKLVDPLALLFDDPRSAAPSRLATFGSQ